MSRAKTIACYQALFDKSNEEAQRVLQDLSSYCFLLTPTASKDTNNKVDQFETARNEGRREVILHILEYMNVNFGQLEQMLQAQKESQEKWKNQT